MLQKYLFPFVLTYTLQRFMQFFKQCEYLLQVAYLTNIKFKQDSCP